jgi:hypothetical protein
MYFMQTGNAIASDTLSFPSNKPNAINLCSQSLNSCGVHPLTLPENKANIIEQLQQQGHFICYIGK